MNTLAQIFALLLFVHEESRDCRIDNDTLYVNKIDVIFALHASGAGYIDRLFEIVEEAVESGSFGASCIATLPVSPLHFRRASGKEGKGGIPS